MTARVPLIHLGRVDSTQDFLVRHAELCPCGVLADCQEAGRGRRGNVWDSAPGAGLWLSACLPVPPVPPGLVLQRAMGVVAEVLELWGVVLGLKWPNDLVAWKAGRLVKLGGIIGQTKGDRLILGVGVNLASAPSLPERAIPPACLAELAAGLALPGSEALARAILDAWADLTVQYEPGFRWPETGDPIRWAGGSGVCQGWLEDGRLAVRTEAGMEGLTVEDVSGLAVDEI
jgi:BirA family biotin operon repressor/biotin-[acetyl-CoA-carboxylase] ligase